MPEDETPGLDPEGDSPLDQGEESAQPEEPEQTLTVTMEQGGLTVHRVMKLAEAETLAMDILAYLARAKAQQKVEEELDGVK